MLSATGARVSVCGWGVSRAYNLDYTDKCTERGSGLDGQLFAGSTASGRDFLHGCEKLCVCYQATAGSFCAR